MIHFRQHETGDAASIEKLFTSVFTESEGESEGRLVGNLARDLIEGTQARDLYGFVAEDGDQIVGAIFFSRLTFEAATQVFILSPVAVHTHYQGKGIGRQLIHHGLGELKADGVTVVVTYGDPAFYSKVGFSPLSQERIQAPLPLSQPHGWLGQSLHTDAIKPIPGRCSCVRALDNPAYW